MSGKKETPNSRAPPLNLTTPRRDLKILSSPLDTQQDTRAHNSNIQYNCSHSDSKIYKVTKPARYLTSHESICSRRSHHIHNKSLHEDSTKALSWVNSLINRGKSILSTMEKEDSLFERELEKERQRSQLHDSLMNTYTGSNKPHQRLLDLKKRQYGTDTSFQNNDEIPLDSFISSVSPEVEDETSSNISFDEDEDLEDDRSSVKSNNVRKDENDLFGEGEDSEDTGDRSDASIIILSDEEYAGGAASRDVSDEGEYNSQEEEQAEKVGRDQEQENAYISEVVATVTTFSNISDHKNYSRKAKMQLENNDNDDDDLESSPEKYGGHDDVDEDVDESYHEGEAKDSIDFSKYMQPRTSNIKASNVSKHQSCHNQIRHTYSEDGTFDSGSVNISMDDESEGERNEEEGSSLYSEDAASMHFSNEQELLDSESDSGQESEKEKLRDFEYEVVHGKENTLEKTHSISDSKNKRINKGAHSEDEKEDQESGRQSDEDDSIQISSDDSIKIASDDSFHESNIDDSDSTLERKGIHSDDGGNYEAISESTENNLDQQQQNFENSEDNLYDLAKKAMLQLQEGKNLIRFQAEEKVSESDQDHSDRIDISTISSQEIEEQTSTRKDSAYRIGNENPEVHRDGSQLFDEVITEKASEKYSENPLEGELKSLSADSTLNNLSIVDEDTVYYSLDETDVGPENFTNAPVLKTKPTSSAYEIVFSGSVYSSTSSEDNSEIMPSQVEYASPFVNDPFDALDDDYEKKNSILKSTLAALAGPIDSETEEQESTEFCSTFKSGSFDVVRKLSEEIHQMSDSDENTDTGNEDMRTENNKEKGTISIVTTAADKSIEENVDETYFSAVNYTNIREDSSSEEVIEEPALGAEGDSRLCVKEMNEVETSTDCEDGKGDENDNMTRNVFAPNSSDEYQPVGSSPGSPPIKIKSKDSDTEKELLGKDFTTPKLDADVIIEGPSEEMRSQDSSHQENATHLEVNYKVVDLNRKHDKGYTENSSDEDPTGSEFGYEVAADSANGGKKISMGEGDSGFIEPKSETAGTNDGEELPTKEISATLPVEVHNENMFTEVNCQKTKRKDEEMDDIKDVNTNEAQITVIETIDEDVNENSTKKLEKTWVEKTHYEDFSGTKTTALEENANMNNRGSQASSESEQKVGCTGGESSEDDIKVNLEVQPPGPKLQSVKSLKPVSTYSNVFSSPIRALETVRKEVGKVVDLAESFVKKIDVMDSESDDAAGISNGSEELSEDTISCDASDDTEKIIRKEKDNWYKGEATAIEEVTTKAYSSNHIVHAINMETTKNGHDEGKSSHSSCFEISEQELMDNDNLQESKGSLIERLQLDQNNDYDIEEEEDESIYREKKSANIHADDIDDIEKQQLLKNLNYLQNYSQKLTENFKRGTDQVKSKEIDTGGYQDMKIEKPVEEKYVGAIEEDSVPELDTSAQSIESEEDLSKEQEKSIEELHSEPEGEKLFALDMQTPTQTAAFAKSDDEEKQRGVIPSTDLPSDPPSDTEETTDSYTNLKMESKSLEMDAPISQEVYEILSDTPNEVLLETNDELTSAMLEKDNKGTKTPTLDDGSEDSSYYNISHKSGGNSTSIKVDEGEGFEFKAEDIPIEIEIEEEQEKMPSNSTLEGNKLKAESNNEEGLGINDAEVIGPEEEESKTKKKSRKRNYNSRRRKRKITEDSSTNSRSKRSKGHGVKARKKNARSSGSR
ncbi:hypothetical protein SKDZ_13G3450 [Saccharomyces kudriavzevii ZP591]|nr:hypothetical protein SKDZ_13G3450 [Saccharomyces kudriavzevii ZP591]